MPKSKGAPGVGADRKHRQTVDRVHRVQNPGRQKHPASTQTGTELQVTEDDSTSAGGGSTRAEAMGASWAINRSSVAGKRSCGAGSHHSSGYN